MKLSNRYNLANGKSEFLDNYFILFFYGFFIRVVFSTLGHNTDWPFIKSHALMTSERLDVYSVKDFYPYFPSRFLIEIPIFKISESLGLSTYSFLDLERVFFIFTYFLIQSLFLLSFKKYIKSNHFRYFHTSLLLGFIGGFTNQLDVFVIILPIVCLNVFYKSENIKTLIFMGIYFFFFSSIKPLMLPSLFFLLFLNAGKKLIYFYIGNLISSIILFIIFFTGNAYLPNYDFYYVLSKILGYKGFNNMPLINLLNLNFDFKLEYLRFGTLVTPKNLLILCFFIFLSLKIKKNYELKIDYFIYQYLILFFIFAPTIAQQNLPILFIAMNLFLISNIKNKLIYFELITIAYLILLNMLSLFDGAITNTSYLINNLYNFLNYYGLVFIPDERYFSNFVFIAILYYIFYEKKIKQQIIESVK